MVTLDTFKIYKDISVNKLTYELQFIHAQSSSMFVYTIIEALDLDVYFM